MNRTLSLAVALSAAVGVAGLVFVPAPRVADAAEARAAKTYAVDPVHSTIVFSALYMGQSPFYGMFTQHSGALTFDGDPSSLTVDVVAPLDSLFTHNAQRDAHLKSPDWFNAAENPNVRFTGSGAREEGDGYVLEGELTLNGQTRPVEVTLTHLRAGGTPRGERLGIGGTFTIQRSDFGVTTMMGDNGIGDDIILHFGIQAVFE